MRPVVKQETERLHTQRTQKRIRNASRTFFWYLVLIPLALLFLLPLLWMMSTAFKTPAQTAAFPPEFFPHPWTLENLKEGLISGPFTTYFKNTVFVVSLNVVGTILSCALAGFGFARLDGPLKNFWFIVMLGTMMIPSTVTLLPIYFMYAKLGWIDTYLPLIVPSFLGGNAFGIFLMRQFFLTIPKQLDEAATLDGCSTLGLLFRIYLPLSKPALIVVSIFTFVSSWNDFFGPLIFLVSPEKYTLAVGLAFFQNQYGGAANQGPLMAMAFVSILPVIILYLIAQRYFVQGITTTGLK